MIIKRTLVLIIDEPTKYLYSRRPKIAFNERDAEYNFGSALQLDHLRATRISHEMALAALIANVSVLATQYGSADSVLSSQMTLLDLLASVL